jgi:membrane-associated phospholipid phosphatase
LTDMSLSQWLHSHPDDGLIQAMLVITHWHSTVGLLLMAAALGVVLHFRDRRWLLPLLVCVPGGMLVNVAVKHLVHRARPHFDDPLLTLASYSFPSGHTVGATLFYGFLAFLLLAHVRRPAWRKAIVGVAVVMVLLVAFSRVYLGVHYFTDVAAAMVEGLLWLALCVRGAQYLRQRGERAAPHAEAGSGRRHGWGLIASVRGPGNNANRR